MPVWDPTRYLQFADDRARPFLDLIAQIPTQPSTIVDLGCGPGHLTKHLRARWPGAEILGVDSSAEMINTAIGDNTDALANYDVADLVSWTPSRPTDLFVSNAAFQWVPDQFDVIDRLLERLTDGGTFAIQVPNNADSATHRTIDELARSDPYREQLDDVRRLPTVSPHDYLTFFAQRGLTVNAWETTYLHVLHGPDPVYEWISGTGLRPFLQALDGESRARFADDLRERLAAEFVPEEAGTVLPFRRTFAVATRA
ncbi:MULTISPECIES: methyltransferase domain-containing protein [unclassified Gordonia (in: high G+C Gram-positive bacteria)]|uniref:methyltransferase domain-containing protein n=1 Tax=unclassified Gordonia (in: high G+C Gram-positive bacteria) TaxID=2657482 RepID=UPI001F106878|nr:methyltransferase domain-containing protein [Gordonia sp. ABSL49_1]MCH5641104.1 methyltransferase domain-containing protein [Gordonia sp. ABSL49_1]